jgi:hypothetical protein
VTDYSFAHPEELDPEYERHGGFPEYGPAEPGTGFRRFVTTMRRVQDLAVSANPGDDVWDRMRRAKRRPGGRRTCPAWAAC